MGIRYSGAFIEQALFKVYSRAERTVKSVAVELNINHQAYQSKKNDAPKIGMPSNKWSRCMKRMPCQMNHCKPKRATVKSAS